MMLLKLSQKNPCHPSHGACHEKGQKLVRYYVDSHGLCGNVIVPYGYPGSAWLGAEQVGHSQGDEQSKADPQVVDLFVRINGKRSYGEVLGHDRESLLPAPYLAYELGDEELHRDPLGRYGGHD